MSRGRALATGAAAAVAVAGAIASTGSARLTLLNAGVRFDYPAGRAAGALLAALAAAALAVTLRAGWTKLGAALLSITAVLASAHLFLYTVEAGPTGLQARGLLGARRLAWDEVAQVDTVPGLVVLTGTDGGSLKVDTTDFRPEDRSALDRLIARRVAGRSR